MTAPVQTPNRATTTHPERSSRRVTHKTPLAWLPWLVAGLLALLLLLTVLLVAAANDNDENGATGSGTTAAALSAGTLAALSDKALIGGAGANASVQSNAPGQRQSGTAGTVLFAEDSAVIDAQGRRVVSVAAANLKAAGVKRVQVVGYTDVVAGTPVNVPLSQQRADAVAALLRKDLPGVTVTAAGRGEQDPVASNGSDAGRQQNRRAAILARS